MLETPHSLLGAAVGAATGNPWLAAPAGVGSHLAGDVMPHWNPAFPFRSKTLYALTVADFLLASVLVVSFALIFPGRPEIAVGAFFGMLPDIVLGLRYVFRIRWLRWYEWAHGAIHVEVGPWAGILPQLAVAAAAIWYLARL